MCPLCKETRDSFLLSSIRFLFFIVHSNCVPSLLVTSRNKSFVLLSKFVNAIRSAYRCDNKICLLSLFQVSLHLSDALRFLSSDSLALSLLCGHFTWISVHHCFTFIYILFTNTKNKTNCFSSWQPRDSPFARFVSLCSHFPINTNVFFSLIRINCNWSQKQFANVYYWLTTSRITRNV